MRQEGWRDDAGKIDAAKLPPHYAAIDKLVRARREKQSAVLDGLYALLDPAQRALVVKAVRAKRILRREPFGEQVDEEEDE